MLPQAKTEPRLKKSCPSQKLPASRVPSTSSCLTSTPLVCSEDDLDNMAGVMNPIASGTGGLEFSRLQSDEIRRISVKRIHVTPALDSMLGPSPGGLHDPALGAIGALDAK